MNRIKFATPDVGILESRRVTEAIDSRWLTNGPVVREFEKCVAEISGADHAVCLDSCSNAMELALRLLGIGPGDEVITTPFTYTSTADAIHHVGAKIVFVDLDGESFEMDYEKVAEAITENTKAVMPVDYGGKICDYAALIAAVSSRCEVFQPDNELQAAIGRVAIVADAAHSFGADQGNKVSGQFADFTCFSFHVLKNITTGGEGGATVWRNFGGIDNDALETRLRLLADHGQTTRDKSGGWEYDIVLLGHNSIMTNLDAAMGLAQLERLEELSAKRIEVTHRYDTLFEDVREVEPMLRHFGPDYTSAMYLYPIWFDLPQRLTRNDVYRRLAERGIPCNVHYKPLPMMTAYRELGFDIKDFPNAYGMYESMLTIPYHTELTAKEQEYIVEQIREAVLT